MASEPVTAPDTQNERAAPVVPRRVSLGRSRRRLSFERRLRLWLAAFAVPALLLVWLLCRLQAYPPVFTVTCVGGTALLWAVVASYFYDGMIRPLQTLSNIVASLREDDYSFRARGARRGDAMGDLALEINALAGTMQRQRNSAMDALALADRVMRSMQSPVLAFDGEHRLRLMNASAERAFALQRGGSLGRTAQQLQLAPLLAVDDERIYTAFRSRPGETPGPGQDASPRWAVRRASFRLYGIPHTLFVLSDVAAALREEERLAWQRLIRVLGHEINNSLTPIKSIASTLRSRPLQLARDVHTSQDLHDFRRGLAVIEDRADSLNRFLQAYQELSRLPPPRLQPLGMRVLVERTAPLEPRVRIAVEPSPDVVVHADVDQLQQMLINLLKNAADAALDPEAHNTAPQVLVQWRRDDDSVILQVIDNGPGLASAENLFVPFYTTKPNGAGIGLTLSRQIAAAHHGSVHLRNRADTQGCIAEISLPLWMS